MKIWRWLKPLLQLALLVGIGAALYVTRDRWMPIVFPPKAESTEVPPDHPPDETPPDRVELSELALKNLQLTTKPLRTETFWKTISVPGQVIDRPGAGDRSIVAPATGVITEIRRVAGDGVNPGDALFTLKLLSETLHQSQTDLFKAAQDLKLAEEQKIRLVKANVPEARIIEIDNQTARLVVAIKASRQELTTRGLTTAQIDGIASGTFVTELTISAPQRVDGNPLEIQEIKVELGQHVAAGATLVILANHRVLAIEGRAFREESTLVERAMKEGWSVEVDFGEFDLRDWSTIPSSFTIGTIANTIDSESRTFRFLMPLDNQSRLLVRDGRSQSLWRFRPGQRVKLNIRTESILNVFVLPADAVVKDGAEWYLFRQSGDEFVRKPIHVIAHTKEKVVIANDGSVASGIFVAQTAATQLNRMLKGQSAGAHAGHNHDH